MIRKKAVTGSRNWTDRESVESFLSEWHAECVASGDILEVIVGDCKTGADAIAREWCRARSIRYHLFVADWDLDGKAAGPIRNRHMAEAQPEECAAFPLKGNGTWDCVKQMNRAGIPVMVVPERRR